MVSEAGDGDHACSNGNEARLSEFFPSGQNQAKGYRVSGWREHPVGYQNLNVLIAPAPAKFLVQPLFSLALESETLADCLTSDLDLLSFAISVSKKVV
jgi:hypothetical protein